MTNHRLLVFEMPMVANFMLTSVRLGEFKIVTRHCTLDVEGADIIMASLPVDCVGVNEHQNLHGVMISIINVVTLPHFRLSLDVWRIIWLIGRTNSNILHDYFLDLVDTVSRNCFKNLTVLKKFDSRKVLNVEVFQCAAALVSFN